MSYSRASILRWGLRAMLLVGLLAATTGVTDTPAVAATPRAALPAQTTPAGSLSRAVADDHKDGQGRDDDEDNEADGVSETQDDILDELGPVGRGVSNIIRLRNHQDGRLRIRGNIDLNRIYGPHIEPRNAAMATATCTDCQTVVVALQLNLYRQGATDVQPVNLASAVNVQCTRCATVAVAIQYVLPVDDPRNPGGDVDELIHEMDQELHEIQAGHRTTTDEAEARLNDIIARFTTLAEGLNKQRSASIAADDATPTPTGTPSVTVTPTLSPTTDTGAGALPSAALDATPTATLDPAANPAAVPAAAPAAEPALGPGVAPASSPSAGP